MSIRDVDKSWKCYDVDCELTESREARGSAESLSVHGDWPRGDALHKSL